MNLSSDLPLGLLTFAIQETKFISPKSSSHKILSGATSLSSMEIKIIPVSFSKVFARDKRLDMKESHLLCLYPSSLSTNLSLYLKSLCPVLNGGSM